mmetsp:Transcript_48159/g.111557  ORF Transcript_48159/g.111557 Transcript_48159/m.111557 type:complete len:736 (-) Transcript_48159:121-2328(-)
MGVRHSCPPSVCCQTTQGSCCCDEIADENAPTSGVMSVQGIAVLEWGPGSAPIGKVLDETLGHLGPLDRQLLLFSSTSSLAAVRWLLHLGACWDACDANGSTCLHVACRSGGISIVMELMRHRQLIEATDVASWTPLHIAAHMGRREAVIRLLAARASPHRRNAMGHTPAQICIDQSTKQALLIDPACGEDLNGNVSAVPLSQVPCNDSVGIPIECEPELFFVTPEPAIRDTASLKAKLLHLAVRIFNLQPSYGLAFIVASGLTDSYTAAMKMVLRSGEASRACVGAFLGASFSLCPLIRFGIFDSLSLLHTGVVSALVLAFHSLQVPEDLHMIDRLVRGVALVWWRKHRAEAQVRFRPEVQAIVSGSGELVGHDLLQYLASSDVLSQLMLSTVLLHWYVYGDGRDQRREMAVETWLALNRGIENGGTDVPDHVQTRIHAIVRRKFIPQLYVASSLLRGDDVPPAESMTRGRGSNPGGATPQMVTPRTWQAWQGERSPQATPRHLQGSPRFGGREQQAPTVNSALRPDAAIEGWVQILGGDLPRPGNDLDFCAGVPEASCRFEECGEGSGGLFGALSDELLPGDSELPSKGFKWASLCYVLLFFAVRPAVDAAGAPYAVVDARRIRIASIDSKVGVVRFAGLPPETGSKDVVVAEADSDVMRELPVNKNSGCTPGSADGDTVRDAPVAVVILLPDGRWREVSLAKLEMKFPTVEEMQSWVAKLIRGPLSCKTHAL